jgi:hypothetical protein
VVDHDPAVTWWLFLRPRYYRNVVLRNGVIVGMVFAVDTSKCGCSTR